MFPLSKNDRYYEPKRHYFSHSKFYYELKVNSVDAWNFI